MSTVNKLNEKGINITEQVLNEEINQQINKDTNLVIGAGIFGLNIALNLIEKGEKVLLITETFESISYHYPIGAHTSKLKTDNLSLYSFNTKIINPLWIINLILNYNYKKYNRLKQYCADYGYKLFKDKYNVEIYKNLNNDLILDSKFIINFILNKLNKSDLFNYKIRSIDIKNKKVLKNLSNSFKNVYVCVGSKCKSHLFLQKIGGYKFYVNTKSTPDSIDVDNGYFLNNNNIFDNPKYKFNQYVSDVSDFNNNYNKNDSNYNKNDSNKNKTMFEKCNSKVNILETKDDLDSKLDNTLVVRGGILLGDKSYHEVIYQKNEEYDYNKSYRDNINDNLTTNICKKFRKKIYKLNQNKFWKKYECYDIQKIMKGVRGVSVDNLPFYYKKNNIFHIEGGSFIGIITAPVLVDSLINDQKTLINFNISRLYINTIIKILIISMLLILIHYKVF